jgi:F-type H+-transporting ATPase subunit b
VKRPLNVMQTIRCLLIFGAFVGTIVLFCAGDVLAAETQGFTRSDWDAIMRWVNFVILAVLIIKYARKPLSSFLQNKVDEVARLLEGYENQKKAAEAKIAESQQLLADNEQRLKVLEERIVSEGERNKAKTIEDARSQSRIMLETAQLKIEGQLREAHGQLKAEIIDAAIEKAVTKIPSVLTADDHQRLLHQWIEAAR